MKKLLSLIIALALLISLGAMIGCAKEETPAAEDETPAAGTETPAAGTETPAAGAEMPAADIEVHPAEEPVDLSKTLPNEHVPEKLAAGMEVLAAMSFVNLGDPYTAMLDGGLREAFEAQGITYTSESAGGDLATQVTQVENFMSMNCALIVIFASDGDAFFDIIERAGDSGTHIVLQGQQSDNENVCSVYQDAALIGTTYANLALAWVDQAYPDAPADSVHYASLEGRGAQEAIIRFDTMNEVLEADPRMEQTYMKAGAAKTADNGYLFAEEAWTTDPDIVLFITMTSSEAIGVNNYVLAQPGADLDRIMILGGDVSAEGQALVDASAAGDGTSVIRGIVGFGGATPFATTAEVCLGLLLGTIEPPVQYIDPVYTYDVLGFDYHSHNT